MFTNILYVIYKIFFGNVRMNFDCDNKFFYGHFTAGDSELFILINLGTFSSLIEATEMKIGTHFHCAPGVLYQLAVLHLIAVNTLKMQNSFKTFFVDECVEHAHFLQSRHIFC